MSDASAPAWWTAPSETPAGDRGRYLVARDHIARQIHSGVLKPGGKLPSERQLQDGLGVARGTIREALFQLESEGMIYRRDRSGWYVSPEPVVTPVFVIIFDDASGGVETGAHDQQARRA